MSGCEDVIRHVVTVARCDENKLANDISSG